MSYNVNTLAKLDALKALGQKQKKVDDAQNSRIKALEDVGAQANVIESVKVNGTVQAIAADKSVDLTMPTKVSDLSNDSKFQTESQVSTTVKSEIAKSGHASFQKAAAVPSAGSAVENVMYLVKNAKTGHYDIYSKVKGDDGSYTMEQLDDTTVDLSGYVEKEDDKGLSTNDYSTAEKDKLAGVADGATKVEASATAGNIKVNGVETPVVAIATDDEVNEMLAEIYGE